MERRYKASIIIITKKTGTTFTGPTVYPLQTVPQHAEAPISPEDGAAGPEEREWQSEPISIDACEAKTSCTAMAIGVEANIAKSAATESRDTIFFAMCPLYHTCSHAQI